MQDDDCPSRRLLPLSACVSGLCGLEGKQDAMLLMYNLRATIAKTKEDSNDCGVRLVRSDLTPDEVRAISLLSIPMWQHLFLHGFGAIVDIIPSDCRAIASNNLAARVPLLRRTYKTVLGGG